MKRMIRFLPILFLLPLLGFIPNGQKVEKVEAVTITTSDRYFIATEGRTHGIEKNPSSTSPSLISYNNLAKPFVFEEVTGGYKVKNIVSGRYLCHVQSGYEVRFPSSISDYVSVWNVGVIDNHTYLKSSENRYLHIYDNSTWRTTADFYSTCYLNIFSVEEDAAPFVTAMNKLACDDYVNGPAKTDKEASSGHSSWESIEAAFNGLQQPTKNYLKTLASDKTEGTIDTIEKALAKYDYIVNKYNKGGNVVYTEFITGRNTSGLATNVEHSAFNAAINNYPIIIATVLVVTLSLTSILLIKKKQK